MQSKRQLILEYAKLGMEFDRAALLAECSLQEQEELEKDDGFQRSLKACNALVERDLLKELSDVKRINVACGNSTEVRWMLERLNRKRWGGGGSSVNVRGGSDGGAFNFTVEFVDGTTNTD